MLKAALFSFLATLLSADAFAVGTRRSLSRGSVLLLAHQEHPRAVDVETMCMMNLAEHCASGAAPCAAEDREALAAWVAERGAALREQAGELSDLSARLLLVRGAAGGAPSRSAWPVSAKGGSPPSRRDVQSLMTSISACLSLEDKREPHLV